MKKLIILFVAMLPFLLGQATVYYDVVPVAWDGIAPIAGSTLTYEVFRAPFGNENAKELMGETVDFEYSVSIDGAGEWIVGVRTVETRGGQKFYSVINWSHENGIFTPNPFIVRRPSTLPAPTGLRLK